MYAYWPWRAIYYNLQRVAVLVYKDFFPRGRFMEEYVRGDVIKRNPFVVFEFEFYPRRLSESAEGHVVQFLWRNPSESVEF